MQRISWVGDYWKTAAEAIGFVSLALVLTYGSFYLKAGKLLSDGLTKFDQFHTLAEEAGIYVHPTETDHWEGLSEWARGDRIADEKMLSALEAPWGLWD